MKTIYLLITGCLLFLCSCTRRTKPEDNINQQASLPAGFDLNALHLKVLTSFINKKTGTMATLYGNEPAFNNAAKGWQNQQPGAILALVTWKQQEDQRWYGANIPGELQSAELVKTQAGAGNTITTGYQQFSGPQLAEVTTIDSATKQQRLQFLLAQHPAVMP